MPPSSVKMYTRPRCCLCDKAHQVLLEHGLEVELVDIDQDPDLQQRYGHSIPVVEIDGKERFRGKVDPVLLRRLLTRR
jgi:glutaredoxin